MALASFALASSYDDASKPENPPLGDRPAAGGFSIDRNGDGMEISSMRTGSVVLFGRDAGRKLLN